jgi:hypothetical protein
MAAVVVTSGIVAASVFYVSAHQSIKIIPFNCLDVNQMNRVELTFETGPIGNLEYCMLWRDCIFRKSTMWCHHRVKSGNSISNLELIGLLHVRAKRVDSSSNVISAVERLVHCCEVAPI